MTWLVVLNPGAGRAGDAATRLERALEASAASHRIVVSRDRDHVAELIGAAVADGFDRFAAVGGDGTAHLVLNAIMGHRWAEPPRLAILPAGSGSDFIRTFALPRRLEDAVHRLETPDLYRCDVGRIEGGFGECWFLNAVNFGVAAASAGRAERLPRWMGGLRYTAAFWLELARFRPGPAQVRTERRVMAVETSMNVVVANGQFFGGGLNVAPQAATMDGLLDVEIFAGPRRRAFGVMPRVIRGLHLRHPAVTVGKGARLDIDVPADWPVEADGEMLGRGPARVMVVPAAIDFKI